MPVNGNYYRIFEYDMVNKTYTEKTGTVEQVIGGKAIEDVYFKVYSNKWSGNGNINNRLFIQPNINIKTDKYVSSNNANEVNKNTYTWKIDRSNRDDVSIKATIMKNMADKEVEPKVIFKNVFKAIMVFLLISGGIYLYLQIEKGNKI